MNVLHKQKTSGLGSRRSPWSTFYVQLLIGLFVGIILPIILYDAFVREILYINFFGYISFWLSSSATVIAIVISRKFILFPGMSAVSVVLPSFAFTYGVALVLVLALRLDYSTVLLAITFLCSVIVHSFLITIASKSNSASYFLVPGGHIDRLVNQTEFDAVELQVPEVPRGSNVVIVADLHFNHCDAWERKLAEAALCGVPVYHYKNIMEDITGRVRIDHLSENSFGSLLPNMAWVNFKRIFDIMLCLLAIPIVFIPLVVVAILIKIDTPGPVIFRQARVGYRGKVFDVIKLRTMRVQQAQAMPVDSRSFAKTEVNDIRITPIGKFLRRSRLDELPQIVNILRGEMSWIGPRPEALPLSEWYSEEIPFYAYRHIVRPGITGWAQVNQGHVTDLEDISEKLQYDFYYIKHFSYWIDIYILLRTVGIILTGFGSK